MDQTTIHSSEIREVTTLEEIKACYKVLRQLRPQLTEVKAFVEQIERQFAQGYRLACCVVAEKIQAVMGYRFVESLGGGKLLYIDELVTDVDARKKGFASRLLKWVIEKAKNEECYQVHLDSGPHRHAAHRLYMDHGFKIAGYHFVLNFLDEID